MKRVYVASSWRNVFQSYVVNKLRSCNYEVYDFKNPANGVGGFSWSEIDPKWMDWTTFEYIRALGSDRACEGFNSDFNAMKWADICVMVLPCGRSANTEAGWMKGAGKTVYVLQPIPQEPELMYKIYDAVFSNIDDLISHMLFIN